MEVHPAGLSADGMRQAHDQGSGREVSVIVGRLVVPCILLTAGFFCCFSDCIAYHYVDAPAAGAAKLACESKTIKGLCLFLLLFVLQIEYRSGFKD